MKLFRKIKTAKILRFHYAAAFKMKHHELVAFSIGGLEYSESANLKICTLSPSQENQTQTLLLLVEQAVEKLA